jgi:glycosyltransferase involved in cell wall biosynthesis
LTAERALRVAFLTSARLWRGSGVSLAKIAAGLESRGHRPHMLAGSAVVRDRFAALGLPATLVRTRTTGIREVRELHRQLRTLGTDVVVVDKPRDLRLSALATLGTDAALLYRYNHSLLGGPLDLRTRFLIRRARGCIFQSEQVRREALRQSPWLGRSAAWVIPNGYDFARFTPDPAAGAEYRRRLGIKPGVPVVLTVSALEKGKGQEVAIEALALLRKSPRAVYLLCGTGDQEARLRELASRLDVPVRFLGHLEVNGIVAALNAADLVVHPSLQDIFPNAVGEAMSCGRPVVASDVGGIAELVGHDATAGVLLPPGDSRAFASTVGALLDDPGRRAALGTAARRRITDHFPLSRMLDGYEAVLRASVPA